MDIFEAIVRRHSYRGPFLDKPVSREELARIVGAGLRAPSGCNAQTTSFVIVDEPKLVARIGSLHPGNLAMTTARAFIACVVDREPAPVYERYSFAVEDCAAAVENMFLAITALGFATVWIDGWLRRDGRADEIGRMLGLPPEKTVRVLLPIGEPAETRQQKEKKRFEERAFYNRYRG